MSLKKSFINPINELVENGKMVGLLLIGATIFSLSLSNSDFNGSYLRLWDVEVGFSFLHKSLVHWINDGLMAVFFLLVGLEIKREVLTGELASRKQAILPIVAALGGIVVPALIFFLVNANHADNASGWAIPTATDIAFSLGILALLGDRVPFSLKIFLTALAIIDDLGAILIIATVYSQGINVDMLLYAGAILLLLILMNRFNVNKIGLYLIPGVFLWYCILKSGIHPTIAGVLLAFTIPASMAEEFEHQLHNPVNYLILPLFALANTAIEVSFGRLGELLSPLSIGIVAGLFIGKPLGITIASWIVVKLKVAELPAGVNWKQVVGLGMTAGIGFTMSIFISSLSFELEYQVTIAKLAILLGSLLSAVAGILLLHSFTKKPSLPEIPEGQ
jgi:NhaA family Na+:H+ antiporter